jgi:hypothetical protein
MRIFPEAGEDEVKALGDGEIGGLGRRLIANSLNSTFSGSPSILVIIIDMTCCLPTCR